jgi:hypothetical protein
MKTLEIKTLKIKINLYISPLFSNSLSNSSTTHMNIILQDADALQLMAAQLTREQAGLRLAPVCKHASLSTFPPFPTFSAFANFYNRIHKVIPSGIFQKTRPGWPDVQGRKDSL